MIWRQETAGSDTGIPRLLRTLIRQFRHPDIQRWGWGEQVKNAHAPHLTPIIKLHERAKGAKYEFTSAVLPQVSIPPSQAGHRTPLQPSLERAVPPERG